MLITISKPKSMCLSSRCRRTPSSCYPCRPRNYVAIIVLLLLSIISHCLCHQTTGSRKATRITTNNVKTTRALEHNVVKRDLPQNNKNVDQNHDSKQTQQKNQSRTKRQMFSSLQGGGGVSSLTNQFQGGSPISNQFPSGSQLIANQMTGNQALTNQFVPPSSSASLNPDDEIRHKLLMTLENRLQERNMLLHDNEVLREKEFLREKEMNTLMSSHPSLFSNTENPLLSAGAAGESRKSLIENNGLFGRPHDALMNGLDNSLLNGHPGMDSSLLGSSSTPHIDGVGSLGDEAMPFGSLGLSKSGYIPVGRVDDNQVRHLA